MSNRGDALNEYFTSNIKNFTRMYFSYESKIQSLLRDINCTEEEVQDIRKYLQTTGVATGVVTVTGAFLNFAHPIFNNWVGVGTGIAGIGTAWYTWIGHENVFRRAPYLLPYDCSIVRYNSL